MSTRISFSRGVSESIRGSEEDWAGASELGSEPANISSIRWVMRGETTPPRRPLCGSLGELVGRVP